VGGTFTLIGGVAANNPSMCALAQALDPKTGKQHLGDVRLLSVGTGACPKRIEGDHDWGLAQWAPNLLGIVFDGVAGVADFQCRQVLGEHYHRLDVVLDEPGIGLDDCEAIPELERRAEAADVGATAAWLRRHFRPRG
jgi:hypothetical protein